MKTYKNYVNGEWVEPVSGNYYILYNPADKEEELGRFPLSGSEDIKKAVESADDGFKKWKKKTASERVEFVYNLIELIEEKKEYLGEMLCKEEGKILREAIAEINRCPIEMRFITGEALRLAGSTYPSERMGVQNKVVRVPIGVIGAITPWNYPVLTPIRKLIPALISGCTVIFKPSIETPLTAVLLTELFEKAGFPPGTVNLVIGRGSEVGNALVKHPLVKGVSFTGSTQVGRIINRAAANTFTRVQLEMGGSNPLVVAEYSDLDRAAEEIVKGAYTNSGQRCTAIRRVIVLEKHAEELENLIINKVKQFKVGQGMDSSNQIGPLINNSAVETMKEYIESAVNEGATIAAGGKRLTGGIYDKGYYFEPTVITDVSPEMKVAKEEIFGPVLVILRVTSFEEAITITNNNEYGLSSSLFTNRLDYVYDFMEEVESGQVHINHQTSTDTHLPFGGVKNSGHGPFSKGSTNQEFYTVRKVVYIKYK